MENKQTAVEWLIEQTESLITIETFQKWKELKQQAKAMEKEQIVIAGNFCQKEDYHSVIIADSVNGPTRDIISIGEHYYKKTYGK